MRRHKRPTTLKIGTISHGTLRTEDLFPALRDAIDGIRLSRADRAKVRELAKEWDQLPTGDPITINWSDEEIERADGIYADLLQLAESYTPDYCYLEMHEGDGSDLVVWPMIDSLQEAIRNGEVWQAREDGGDGRYYRRGQEDSFTVPHGELYVIVTDHGNVSLYRSLGGGRSVEIWGVV